MNDPGTTSQSPPPKETGSTAGGKSDQQALLNRVTTTYLGGNRVHILAGDRSFEADQRTHLDRPGAGFCPLELVAAALGA